MNNPEEQLRRLAEGRAAQVEAFTPDELERPEDARSGGVVLPFIARRWPSAVAAALLLIVAVGAAGFAAFGGSDPDDEFVAEGQDTNGDLDTPVTILDESIVPNVVGLEPTDAIAELEERGLEPEFSVLYVDDDELLGRVVAQSLPGDHVAARGETVVLQVAQLLPTSLSTDPCQRPAHLTGTFDDDRLPDAVYPRFVDGVIDELEVCTAAGSRPVVYDLSFVRLAATVDLDQDGLDEIVGPLDDAGTRWGVLAMFDDGEMMNVVSVDRELLFGARVDGANDWWGCVAFAEGSLERLATGTWRTLEDGSVEWEMTEQNVVGAELVAGETISGTAAEGATGPPGRARCEPTRDEPPGCDISEAEVAVFGDVDGDGTDDALSPRDDLICFGNGTFGAIGEPAVDAEIWFLDDIEDDGRLELFTGSTTYALISVRPWSLGEDGVFAPAADEGCCVQHLPRQILPEHEDGFTGEWFSCVAARGDAPAELVSGRFWHAGGTVEWTIDVGQFADPELRYRADVDTPRDIDAWRPGNGCRGTAPTWRAPVVLTFNDDGSVVPESLAAFNAWVLGDDFDRRHVRLREALRIGALLGEGETYSEDIEAGLLTIAGLPDDSVTAMRFVVTYDETGTEIDDVERQWLCQPGRGPDDFTTALCA